MNSLTVNGIENFWGYAKHRLSKFKSIKKENFLLHLKECEFRYNNSKNIKRSLLNFNKIDKSLCGWQVEIVAKNPLRFDLVNII